MPSSRVLVVPAVKKHTATVIMAHGLGDSGAGWVDLAKNWRRRSKFEEVAFIFPSAPSIPITVNMGMMMPGWYDIATFADVREAEDEPGIIRSQKYFHELIQKEQDEKHIPSSRIVLGGFSQGGSIAIVSGITCPQKLGGIFGLSSYILLRDKLRSMIPEGNPNQGTPIFMGHGDADAVVKYEWGVLTSEWLRKEGWPVEFKTYTDLAHSADIAEIDDLEKYLKERLPPLEEIETSARQ